jgi:hypothetical protein
MYFEKKFFKSSWNTSCCEILLALSNGPFPLSVYRRENLSLIFYAVLVRNYNKCPICDVGIVKQEIRDANLVCYAGHYIYLFIHG